jgi:hypothetical protein
MATKNDFELLPKLGIAIDASLVAWEAYMETLTDQSTYEAIITNNIQDTSTKANALLHLLETLPTRHAALVISYGDEKIKFVELSNPCANLLQELQKPESDVELTSWFNRTIKSKKLVNCISQVETDIKTAEQGRMQELKRLKASHLSLTMVHKDGELGSKDIDKLLDAMEEIGVDLAVPGAFIDVAEGSDGQVDHMASSGRLV